MATIPALIAQNLTSIKLNILVFGPNPQTQSNDPQILALTKKRIEIRDNLTQLGHNAVFPESVVIPNGTIPAQNVVVQEVLLIRDYDLIIVLLQSPGSCIEIGVISARSEFALKTQVFIQRAFAGGLADHACELIESLGGIRHQFDYPADLTQCHLLTHVVKRAQLAQLAKFFA